jgi:hypothetical protein
MTSPLICCDSAREAAPSGCLVAGSVGSYGASQRGVNGGDFGVENGKYMETEIHRDHRATSELNSTMIYDDFTKVARHGVGTDESVSDQQIEDLFVPRLHNGAEYTGDYPGAPSPYPKYWILPDIFCGSVCTLDPVLVGLVSPWID